MEHPSNDRLKKVFRGLPYLLALMGFFMFFYTLFGEEPPIQSLYWFLLIIAAFFLPYIKEITFQDIKLKLEEGLEKQQEAIEETREHLQGVIENEFSNAYDKINAIDEEFGEIRDELIRGYQIYLMQLPEAEQGEKVIMLNNMYLKELNVSVSKLKENLRRAGFYNGAINENYNAELLAAVKAFQESQGMVPDGIFGHNSYKNLLRSIEG